MKTSTMNKAAYVKTYGELRTRPASEETLAMWNQIQKLGVAEYLILEPEKGEKIQQLRASWQVRLNKFAWRLHSNFVVRACLNREEDHVVLWKEPRPSPANGAPNKPGAVRTPAPPAQPARAS